MNSFFLIFAYTLGLLVLAIVGFSIKSFFKKDGQFNGTCAQNNARLKNAVGECTVCGKKPSECELEAEKG